MTTPELIQSLNFEIANIETLLNALFVSRCTEGEGFACRLPT